MKTLLSILLPAVLAQTTQPTTRPASNDDEPNAPVGKRPYELDWANRTEPDHGQLVDFENLAGWQVTCRNGATAQLHRTQQEFCFGQYAAKLVYTGTSLTSAVVLAPPQPLPIGGKFTGVNLWVRGSFWGWIHPIPPRRATVRVLVLDAKNEQYAIDLGMPDFDYWFLMHATLVSPTGDKRMYTRTDPKSDEIIDYPARFAGIEVSGFANDEPARMYFDALTFYEMQYPPLTFQPPPAKLPWPTTPDTILPTCKQPNLSRIQLLDNGADFLCGDTYFQYVPKDGTLGDITVVAAGQQFQLCFKGGITFELDGKSVSAGDEGVKTRLVSFKPPDSGKGLAADWELTAGNAVVRYRYTLWNKGKSLIVDITSAGGSATRLDIGLAKGLKQPKTVFIPYLTYGNDWPKVVASGGADKPLFLLSLLDYYNSDASTLEGAPRLSVEGCIGYNGGAVYNRLTNGRRNDLRERLFINVSNDVHEVLPNIPNPKCDTGEIAREFIWRNIGEPQREMLAKYKAYGVDKFIACHHEVGWRDAGESFTMRLQAAPRIGDQGLIDYSAWLRGLGYRFGTYTNYVDFAPVNSNWNENDVCLNSDGSWQKAWPRCYALKPLRAAEKEAYYAPRIHEKFGTDAQYCDVHTAYSPWGRTDYDARTPGAGKFSTQFNAFARLLHNESIAHHGPVFSEGNYHWFYAGIVDGDYATIIPYGQGWKLEAIPDFDLLKMHPLMTDFGMGMPGMYYGEGSHWTSDRSRLSPWFDRFHVSTILFGHIGYLADDWGFDGTLKSYYLLQALQQRYTMVPVRKIRYFDGKALVDPSTAIAGDAHKRRKINVQYENGLEVWCNLSFDQDWAIHVADRDYLLPPASFVAYRPDDILAYSAAVAHQRHELVQARDYLYLDSRNQPVRTAAISARGAVAVKPDGKSAWWIIPATSCEEVTIATEWLGCDKAAAFAATAHDQDGKKIADAAIRRGPQDVTVMPVKTAVKYRLTAAAPSQASAAVWHVDLPTRQILPHESVPARVNVELSGGQSPSGYEVAPECVPPSGKPIPLGHTRLVPGGTTLNLTVPPGHPLHARCWYRLRLLDAKGGEVDARWVDLTALPPYDLTVHPVDQPVPVGESATVKTTVTSYAEKPVDVSVRCTGVAAILPRGLDQPARLEPGIPRTLDWQVTVPQMPIVAPLTFCIRKGDGSEEFARYLRTRPTEWLVADLTKTTMTTGQCIRGQAEQPVNTGASGAAVQVREDRCGGQAMASIFMHPPYMKGVGYSFATFEMKIPAGRPRLDFSLGFSEGSTTTDGCVFKVVVIDGEKPSEVFAVQYAELNKWARHSVDLSPFAGRNVKLKLITDVGPKDDSNSDWACWGSPRVTVDERVMAVELHTTQPPPAFTPPAQPLAGLSAADLSQIVSAEIALETAGVNGDQYASFLYFNGVKIGTTPLSGSDTAWSAGTVPLPPEAIKTIRPENKLVIKNPGGDSMKVRKFCLRFKLADGRQGASWTDVGPYTSSAGWPHTEGTAVPTGADLPQIRLLIPVR